MELTKLQRDILFGHLLGDGFLELHKGGKNASFRLLRTLNDKDYLLWSAKIFKNFLTPAGICEGSVFDNRTKKRYYNVMFRTHVNKVFSDIYKKWYKNRIKVIPPNLKLNLTMVKVWFADDGSVKTPKDKLNKNRFSIKISTNCFTKKEVVFLKHQLDQLFNVDFKIYPYRTSRKPQYVLYLQDKREARKFLRLINKDFPLKRKSDIWNNPEYNLWNDIKNFPKCKFCNSEKTYKNGHNRSRQTFRCKKCGRQFQIKD